MPHYSDIETRYSERMQGRLVEGNESYPIRFRTFCFTGGLDSMKRKEAQGHVIACNGLVSKTVTGCVDIVVAGSIPSTAIIAGELSLKLQKAKQTGKQIITEDTFLQMLRDSNHRI